MELYLIIEAAERNGIIDFFKYIILFLSGNELEATEVWHELSEEYFNKFYQGIIFSRTTINANVSFI